MTQRHNSHNNSGSSGADSQSSVRRKQEDNLAVVFMGIVLVFGVCHAPRLFLSLYEMIDIRRAMDCRDAGEKVFPSWTTIVMCISHFMLVINSSTNMILYIFLNAAFRKHFMELV